MFARERELAARLSDPALGGESAKLRGPASQSNLRTARLRHRAARRAKRAVPLYDDLRSES